MPPAERSLRRTVLPFTFDVVSRSRTGHLFFYNVTEYRDRQEWWSGGSCRWVETLSTGRRYHCNDFELDTDFDDLVFRVEWDQRANPITT